MGEIDTDLVRQNSQHSRLQWSAVFGEFGILVQKHINRRELVKNTQSWPQLHFKTLLPHYTALPYTLHTTHLLMSVRNIWTRRPTSVVAWTATREKCSGSRGFRLPVDYPMYRRCQNARATTCQYWDVVHKGQWHFFQIIIDLVAFKEWCMQLLWFVGHDGRFLTTKQVLSQFIKLSYVTCKGWSKNEEVTKNSWSK